MDKNKIIKYLVTTYVITWIFWGLRAILTSLDILAFENPIIFILYALGSLGPTVAAITLLEDKSLKGIKDFIFNHKKGTFIYFLYFLVVYTLTFYCSTFKIVEGTTLVNSILHAIMYIVRGGGNEELGWRGILQPDLEKKFSNFVTSCIITVPWALWHIPFWFTKGDMHQEVPFLLFVFAVFAMGIVAGAIKKTTNSVFYCVLFHGLSNLVEEVCAYDTNYILIIGFLVILASTIYVSRMKPKTEEII